MLVLCFGSFSVLAKFYKSSKGAFKAKNSPRKLFVGKAYTCNLAQHIL